MAEQLGFPISEPTLCNYGQPKFGKERPCREPATHGARWAKDDKSGGIDCCLGHANYYAVAWCPRYPGERSIAWIEILSDEVLR